MKHGLLHALCLLSVIAMSRPAFAGEPPLVLQVDCNRTNALLGQGIVVEVSVRNVSGGSVKVLRPSASSISLSLGFGGREQATTTVGIDANIQPTDIVTLRPGETVSNSLQVTSIVEPPVVAGKYSLVVSYRSFGADTLQTDLTAQPLGIEYMEPEGDELRAWALFKDRKDKASGLLKRHVLNEIVSKYPGTSYAVEAKKVLGESMFLKK